jgi:hypothetical protein
MRYVLRFALGFCFTMTLGTIANLVIGQCIDPPMLLGLGLGVGIGQAMTEFLERKQK